MKRCVYNGKVQDTRDRPRNDDGDDGDGTKRRGERGMDEFFNNAADPLTDSLRGLLKRAIT